MLLPAVARIFGVELSGCKKYHLVNGDEILSTDLSGITT